ncbi:MAG: hypothetical protein MjAS7_1952 [Metallosphaera javensis (ex Sakai et al. 2022)]|nr:MAG: hypothetical protein MjAS7_1952 [Metallosphaera javensis (ex Sakai et al. 2022)]
MVSNQELHRWEQVNVSQFVKLAQHALVVETHGLSPTRQTSPLRDHGKEQLPHNVSPELP